MARRRKKKKNLDPLAHIPLPTNKERLERLRDMIVSVVAFIIIVGIFLPRSYYTEKSFKIKAPASIIFEEVSNLKKWEKWSPWERYDFDLITIYGELTEGPGAKMWFASKRQQADEGALHIVSCEPNKNIVLQLETDDWKNGSIMTFDLKEEEDGTNVMWTQGGKTSNLQIFIKYAGLSFKGDLEDDFTFGLQRLRRRVEYYRMLGAD